MVLYIVGFAMSWGPVVWVVLSEMFPGRIRGRALSIAVAAQWLANLAVSWSFKVLDGNATLNLWFNHGFAYYLYGTMSILAGLFVWRFVPETTGAQPGEHRGRLGKGRWTARRRPAEGEREVLQMILKIYPVTPRARLALDLKSGRAGRHALIPSL